MPRYIKFIIFIISILLFTLLAACASVDSIEQNAFAKADEAAIIDYGLFRNNRPSLSTKDNIICNENDLVTDDTPKLSPEDIIDFESYKQYITEVSCFMPYYKLIFDFSALSGGVLSVPTDDVIGMYNELCTAFEYINVVSHRPLYYLGNYEGDTRFIYNYEWYQATGNHNPHNSVGRDRSGNEIVTTPIKTVIMCERSVSRLDNYISKGRNLHTSDFFLMSPDEPISVVLGSAYSSINELGDIFSLVYLNVVLDFKVVGFYEQDINFSMDAGALKEVNVDYSIIMPYFVPMYEPEGEDAVFQYKYHVAELISGYIAIAESISEINDDTHAKYITFVEEIAKRYGLSGMYISPLWPVGFVFA